MRSAATRAACAADEQHEGSAEGALARPVHSAAVVAVKQRRALAAARAAKVADHFVHVGVQAEEARDVYVGEASVVEARPAVGEPTNRSPGRSRGRCEAQWIRVCIGTAWPYCRLYAHTEFRVEDCARYVTNALLTTSRGASSAS